MKLLALIPLLALTACATPRETCESDAAAPYRAALQERARISQDLARGYVFQTRFETRRRFGWCRGPNAQPYQCWDTDTQPVTRRVPVEPSPLRARLAELNAALPGLRETAGTDTAQCRALYPEDPAG